MADLVNNGSYFGQTGGTQPDRSGFVRRATKSFSASVGALYPFFFDEILPTDKFDIDTAMTAVLQPSIFPTADQIVADVHYFYAPYRILWDNTKKFFGDVDPGAYEVSTSKVMPYFLTAGTDSSSSALVLPGSVMDYLGVDPGCLVDYFNALPYRMYRMIWNEWYRNTAYQNAVLINKGDTETEYIPYLLHVNRFKDYFSSCLPYPQITEDGAAVSLSGIAQVMTSDELSARTIYHSVGDQVAPMTWGVDIGLDGLVDNGTPGSIFNREGSTFVNSSATFSYGPPVFPSNLGVNFDRQINQIGVTVTALRSAVALQRFLEVEARGGRRYREMLLAHFSSILPDSTAQVPEFIGGARFNISMTANVQTGANSGDQALGSLSGVSITRDRSFKTIPHSFPEHGIIMGLISFRVLNHSYMQGTPRFFFKRTKDDLYWPEFEGVSEEPVYRGEIYMGVNANSLNPNANNPALDVWGYNEYGAEYRYLPSTVSGQMRRSGFNNSFTPWTYADYYTNAPTLSASWLVEPRENVDNTLVYPGGTVAERPSDLDPVYYWNYTDAADPREQLTDQFMVQVGINMFCQRPMPLVSIPGLGGVL